MSRIDKLFLISIFRLYPWLKMPVEHNSVRNISFPSSCFCADVRLSSREMDQKIKFDGTIAYRDYKLEFFFRPFEAFRLHAILHDAVEAVQTYSSKGPGYEYKIRPETNSYFPDRATRLLFFPRVKLLLPSIFQLCRFLEQYVLHCTRHWACRYKR